VVVQVGWIISLALASTANFSGNLRASTSVELTVFAQSETAVGLLRRLMSTIRLEVSYRTHG
jgi:hypothetical protein